MGFQWENWRIAPSARWQKVGRVGWDKLRELEQRPSTLWGQSYGDSSVGGVNNRVPVRRRHILRDSLKLIRVDHLKLDVELDRDGKKRLWGKFNHNGLTYRLHVKDAMYESKCLAQNVRNHVLGDCFLTVSLTLGFKEYAYKLVAAIVERTKFESASRP
ncbi:hypothetical protein GCM10023192_35220 [Amycolatopsis samaneae]